MSHLLALLLLNVMWINTGPICMRPVPRVPGGVIVCHWAGTLRAITLSDVLNSQESGLKVNQPASFAIRLNGAKGKIDAKVHSPSGAVEECHVSELEPGKQEAWGAGPSTSASPGMFLQTCAPTED